MTAAPARYPVAVRLSLLLLLLPALAFAEGLSDQAARQVELCQADVQAGAYERAVGACDSALRLNPTPEVQQQAFKWKGLALLELDRLDEAQAMLLAFKSLRSGMADDPQVEAALQRIEDDKPKGGPGPLPEASKPGVIVAAAGGGLALVGWLVHGGTFAAAQDGFDDATPSLWFGQEASYRGLHGANGTGLALGIAGLGVAAGGSVWAIVASQQKAVAVAPYVAPGPDGVVVGFAGVLP